MTIQIFTMIARGKLETVPATEKGITKVIQIMPAQDYEGGLPFPLPDVFGAAGGKADIAICINAAGKEILVMVPQGQRFAAQTLNF